MMTTDITSPLATAPSPDFSSTAHFRLRTANRDQVAPVPAHLDALVSEDHLVRLIWQALLLLDLSAFYEGIAAIEGGPGRAATDPLILLALWIFATTQGVTSARALTRLCVEHVAYMWLCGGVPMNYHTLSDFRVQHAEALDALMTNLLGHLHHAGLIDFDQVAQDGIRVRASAGAASFRREQTLEQALEQAQAVLAHIQQASAADEVEPVSAREQAARSRAAQERVERLEAALHEMPAAREAKKADQKDKARVSSTDPEARVMKMADGGYRPAYNIQFAADSAHQVIVGVDVTNMGSDMQEAPPMVEQVEERTGEVPDQWSMDGGFASHDSIEQLTAKDVEVLAPVKQPTKKDRDAHQPLPKDSPAVAAWRLRMGTDAAKEAYKLRAATIECVNAHARGRYGLTQLRVRGLAKVKCVGLWLAITHNLGIWVRHLTAPPPALAPCAG